MIFPKGSRLVFGLAIGHESQKISKTCGEQKMSSAGRTASVGACPICFIVGVMIPFLVVKMLESFCVILH